MKKTILILIIIFIFTGCKKNFFVDEQNLVIENQNLVQVDKSDLFNNYPDLEDSLKSKISELNLLWSNFNDEKNDDIDPTEDFHNSEYIKKFKNFLGERDSLAVSQNALKKLLGQYGLESIDKTIQIGEKEYNIRVIGYNVDFDVKAITDHVDIRNKWIFIQCWNEDEFYFRTLSDGGIHSVTDFIPLEINNMVHIILIGYSSPGYPKAPFLWGWCLGEDGICSSDLFNWRSIETDKYFIYDNVNLANSHCKQKWTFYTDGSYLFVEKRSAAKASELWPSDYLNVYCELDEENRMFSFISRGREGIESTIQVKLVNNQFVVE
ncbi:MAG: hypothetical protein CVV02_07260 [Firmicutes bacterium HGW-Firmicutes-7]|nr:MAG: hypothetical protein CVV02_07260 [Firmicutes bacterium HGW-Firmicutes-7]